MNTVYPEIEPYRSDYLNVGDDNVLYWETCGNPNGKHALVVHGGPGSGATPWWRTLFNPEKYNIVLFDQRGCGQSYPFASDPTTSLENNTTFHLLMDMEKLRKHLKIEKWMLLGGSWGSTLALAYAETYPERVSGLILFGVTTGKYEEFDWTFRGGLKRFFPEQWDKLVEGIRERIDKSDVVKAYDEMLNSSDEKVRRKAALDWCTWESATPSWPPTNKLQKRFEQPDFAYSFARIVTHYVKNNAWLEDGIILQKASQLASIPGILIHGRYDFQGPIGNSWELMKHWKKAELVIVMDSGHSPNESLENEIVRATDKFAEQ